MVALRRLKQPNVQRALCLLVVLVVTFGQFPLAAQALTQDQIKAIASGDYYFNTEESAICSVSSTGSTGAAGFAYGSATQKDELPKAIGEITVTPSTDTNATDVNGKIVYQYFLGKGLTPNQVAGLLGNLHWEAHFRADNASELATWGAGGYGIAQWTDSHWPTPGRRAQFVKNMTAAGIGDLYNQAWDSGKTGKTPSDKAGILLGFELDYVWYELTHDYKDSVLAPLKSAVTYQEATAIVYDYYEGLKGSSDTSLTGTHSRTTYAHDDLLKYNGLAALTGTGSICGMAGANGWDITGPNAMTTYEQYDPKYADQPFGVGNIKDCGCGPTSMAMAIATLTSDPSVTPPMVADYYAAHGGQAPATSGCASTWAWSNLSTKWPSIQVVNIGSDLAKATTTIRSGGLVLVSYTGGPFTGSTPDPKTGQLPGHIFLIRAVAADGGFYIANPLGHFAGQSWANQNTTDWAATYFSTKVNDKGGHLNNMWSITKVGP